MPPHALRLFHLDPDRLCAGRAGGCVIWPASGAATAALQDDLTGAEPGQGYALWVRSEAGISSGVPVHLQGGWVLRAAEGGPDIALTRLSVGGGGAAGIYTAADGPLEVGGTYRVARRRAVSRPWPIADGGGALAGQGASGTARSGPGAMAPAAVCFVAGTRIATARGSLPVERLLPGTRVVTRDNGLQPVRWVSSQTMEDAPVHLDWPADSATGRPLVVSPEHRLLLAGPEARRRFGEGEVLVPARCLVGRGGISALPTQALTYVHFALDRHEIVYAEGHPAESFQPARRSIETLQDRAREALCEFLPTLRSDPGGYGPAARLCVTLEPVQVAA